MSDDRDRLEHLTGIARRNQVFQEIPENIPPEAIQPGTGTLSEREFLFVINYVKLNRNGTQAAIAAGYSTKSSRVQATIMLKKLKIREAVEKLDMEIKKSEVIDKKMVKVEILRLVEKMYSEERIPYSTILNALDMLNKLDGNYLHEESTVQLLTNLEGIKIEIVQPKKIE